jgi:hypothetical protein
MADNQDDDGYAPLDGRFSDRMAHLDIDDSSTENGSISGTMDATEVTIVAEEIDAQEIDAEKLATEMQLRCRMLLNELEQFQAHLKKQRKEHTVELRTFRSGLQAEMKLIDKVLVMSLARRTFANAGDCSWLKRIPLQVKPCTPFAPRTSNSMLLYGRRRNPVIP